MNGLYLGVTIFIAIGLILLLISSRYFFEPDYICPRCGRELESIYTETCPQCNLRLFQKCNDCGTYIRTYVNGHPIQYCSKCGSRLDAQPKEIEKPFIRQVRRKEKINYCPNCGSSLREEENPKFCPLCGEKIE